MARSREALEPGRPRFLEEPWRNVSTISRDEFAGAVQLHQSGQLAAAARLYELFLHRDGAHADSLHLLGIAQLQLGRPDVAAELIGRAIALYPQAAVFRATLSEVHRATGCHDRAVDCCVAALQLGLNDPRVYNNLGLALEALGRRGEAVEAFRAALERQPDDVASHINLGTTLRGLDQKDQALACFRRAVAIDPDFAAAQTNLGQLLLDLGQAAQALPHCQRAVFLEPGLPEAQHNLGNALHALGQYSEARHCYSEAIRLRPEMAQAYVNLARTLQEEGAWDEALPWLRRAIEIEPRSLVFLALLAEAAVERDLFDEAIACYQRMLELDSKLAATHNALGWLLQESGRLDEAASHLRTTLSLRSDFTIAHVNLGGIHEKLGDFAAAESCFRAAVSDEKSRSVALARLAMLLRGGLQEADLELIEEQLSGRDGSDPTRMNLLFGVAGVWDARGSYARAASCAREANQLARAEFERRNRSYQPEDHEQLVTGLINSLDSGFFARLSGAGLDGPRPVFIVGLPRSGTTLIEQILASHPQVHGAGELTLVREDFDAIPGLIDRHDEPPVACIGALTRDAARRLADRHDRLLFDLDGGKAARVVDKMPDNYVHLGLIAALFPRATLIYSRRDLRDIAVSCWLTGFRSIRWTNAIEHIASRFQQHVRMMNHWQSVIPGRIHMVDYEETVANLEGTATRLVAACGLEWDPACLQFHRTSRAVRTASFAQVRQPVYPSSVARWKNYQDELADLFAALPQVTGPVV
jgi:tetratricopeptide (TPR) repeat protein